MATRKMPMRVKLAAALGTLIVALTNLAVSWLTVVGALGLIFWCLSLSTVFTYKLGTGIWLIMVLVKFFVKELK